MANKIRTLSMTDPMWEAISDLARDRGRNTAHEIRIAVDAYLRANGIELGDEAMSTAPQARRSMPRNVSNPTIKSAN